MDAVIFPGQGAQYVGMGKSLFDSCLEAQEVFSRVDALLGFSLSQKCFAGPENELKDTSLQQLAILASSIAAYEVFRKVSPPIAYFSGLSLGEYTCLYAAGVLSLDDTFTLVKERAWAMQQAALVNPSTMCAVIGVEKEKLGGFAESCGFYLANFNAPGQVVISLRKEAFAGIKAFLEQEGARVVELPVSGGFHSILMEPAKAHLRGVIANLSFHDAAVPVVSNVTAKAHTCREEIIHNLLEQLISPVRWEECVRGMVRLGVERFFEVGPSKILRGLIRKISPETRVVNIEKAGDLSALAA
jgi:[acyl-carrier-protein] S-malonyltransferase